MFAIALWDARERRLRARARPLRHQAALLPRSAGERSPFASELKALRAAARLLDARSTPTRSRRSSPSTRSRAAHDLPRARASCRPATCWSREARRDVRIERYARRAGAAPSVRARAVEALADELRERLRDSVRAHLVVRRAGRRAAVGRRRLLGARRAGRTRAARASARSRSASRSSSFDEVELARAIARALRHRPPRAGRRARRRRAAADDRRGLRRAVRGLVGAAHVPRLAARRPARQGRALRRGRRRAVRRLRDLRRRPARAAHRPRGARCSRRWPSALPSSSRARAASTTRPSASRAPPTCRRSSATTAGRRSSRPTRAPSCCAAERRGTADPLDVYRARWAETEGADDARAAAGRRPRRSTSSTTCW